MNTPQSPIENRLAALWRSFRVAAWLGWQIESNWTDPFLFVVYSFVKPVAGAAILVVMYGIITQGNFASPMFSYIYLGNAFYMYVGAVMTGISWAVIDDREHYKTLKYIYVAPVHLPLYLIGHGVARFLISSFAVLITLLCGMLFLQLHLDLAAVDWPLFLLGLSIGVVVLAMLGLLLAGVSLLVTHHAGFIGEAVAGALYLFSAVLYPLEMLPAFLRPIGYLMPTTYWLEVLRRALVGDVAAAFPTFSALSSDQLLLILLALSVFFGVLSVFVFRWCNRRARELGLIDRVSNY